MRVIILFCILASITLFTRAAPDIYISATGNDSNDGLTPANAVFNVTRAVSLISSEGTIHISAGYYAYRTTQVLSGNFTLQGAGATSGGTFIDFTTLNGTDGLKYEFSGSTSSIKIKNLLITAIQDFVTAAHFDGSCDLVLEDCRIGASCSLGCSAIRAKHVNSVAAVRAEFQGHVVLENTLGSVFINSSIFLGDFRAIRPEISSPAEVTIESGTFSAQVAITNATASIRNSFFRGSATGPEAALPTFGGCLLLNSFPLGYPTVIDSSNFFDCRSQEAGGSIWANRVDLRVVNTRFINSTVTSAALFAYTGVLHAQGGPLNVQGCSFQGNNVNTGQLTTGGIAADHNVTIIDTIFRSNKARDVGAIQIREPSVTENTFVSIHNCLFEGNSGSLCGAIGIFGQRSVTISGSTFKMNTVSGSGNKFQFGGAAVCATETFVDILDTMFDQNEVQSSGSAGVVSIYGLNTFTRANVRNVTFANNRALSQTQASAGIAAYNCEINDGGDLVFRNNSANFATGVARDIFAFDQRQLKTTTVSLKAPLSLSATTGPTTSAPAIYLNGRQTRLILRASGSPQTAGIPQGAIELEESAILDCRELKCEFVSQTMEHGPFEIIAGSQGLAFIDVTFKRTFSLISSTVSLAPVTFGGTVELDMQGQDDSYGSLTLTFIAVSSNALLRVAGGVDNDIIELAFRGDATFQQTGAVEVTATEFRVSGLQTGIMATPSFTMSSGSSLSIEDASSVAIDNTNVALDGVLLAWNPGTKPAFILRTRSPRLSMIGVNFTIDDTGSGILWKNTSLYVVRSDDQSGVITLSFASVQEIASGTRFFVAELVNTAGKSVLKVTDGNVSACGDGSPDTDVAVCNQDERRWDVSTPLNFNRDYTFRARIRTTARVTFGSVRLSMSDDAFLILVEAEPDTINCPAFESDTTVPHIEFRYNATRLAPVENLRDSYTYNTTLFQLKDACGFNSSRFTRSYVNIGPLLPRCSSNFTSTTPSGFNLLCTGLIDVEPQPGSDRNPASTSTPGFGIAPSTDASISGAPTGAIVGGIIGALAALALIGLILFLLATRRKKRKHTPVASIQEQAAVLFAPDDERETATKPATNQVENSVEMSDFTTIIPGDLVIAQELGKGSQGVVSLATYKGEFVAVKQVSGATPDRIAAMQKEAITMRSIKKHRNLVGLLGVYKEQDTFGIVMEFCPRSSLKSYLSRQKNLTEYDYFKFVHGILDGMSALMASGLIHKDLAARNILLDERLFPRVSDFGSSQKQGFDSVEPATDTDKLGPYKWQSPEVLQDNKFSELSDVWAFGCTVIEIMTGNEPYHGYKGSLLSLVGQIRQGEIDPLSHLEKTQPDIISKWPEWTVSMIRRCFSIDPQQRPSFREIRYRLDKENRDLRDRFDSEIDEADSVLNDDATHYMAVPAPGAENHASPVGGSLAVANSSSSSVDAKSTTTSEIRRLAKLGAGNFGAVYLGQYQGQYVALKVLTISEDSSSAIEREAAIMSSVAPHRSIIRLYGLVRQAAELCLVMELAPKGSLDVFIKSSHSNSSAKTTTITEALIFKWAIGIARGMSHLADSKIVHRDLSTRNILLDSSLEPKIADFGLGRSVLDTAVETSTQTDVGPLRWFAPECFDLKYSEKTDVWAYGCTLIEIVTNNVPFPKLSAIDVAIAVRDGGATPLDQLEELALSEPVPVWLKETMKKCFVREAKQRATFAELVVYLEAAASTIEEIKQAEDEIRKRRQRRAQTLARKA